MVNGWSHYQTSESKSIPILLSQSSLACENSDLEAVCLSVVGVNRRNKTTSDASASPPASYRCKFSNALESLLDRASSTIEGSLDSDSKVIFGDLLSGAGIAEVTGPSGSGKTSFCMHFINTSNKLTLYIDTSGSFSLERVANKEDLICLRVFNCEELEAVILDLKRLLIEDGFLPLSQRVRARAIRNLVIDSLWPVQLLDLHQRASYVLRLFSSLRQISWKNNIAVIVCSNSSNLDSFQARSSRNSSFSSYDNWRSRCYLHVSFERYTSYGEGVSSYVSIALAGHRDNLGSDGVGGICYPGRVRRVMKIRAGNDHMYRRYEFGIKRHSLVLYDR